MRREMQGMNNDYVTVDIDEDIYEFHYYYGANVYALTRKSDNKIIKVFSETLGFISQVNRNDKDYFIMAFKKATISEKTGPVVRVYKCFRDSMCPGLSEEGEYNTFSLDYDEVCPVKGTFIESENGESGIIHSCLTNRLSYTRTLSNIHCYDFDFENKEQGKIYSKSPLLVSEIFGFDYICGIPEFFDRITYGIDPATLRIVTPIYSRNQDRFIPLYTEEDIIKAEKTKKCNYPLMLGDSKNIDYIGTNTIKYEVLYPLEQYMNEHKKEDVVLTSDVYHRVRESFVKRLGEINESNNK